VTVSAGLAHSLVLQPDGTVVAWGDNYYAQSTVPAGLNSVVAMAGGRAHSLALKSDGRVVAWGAYGSGQSDVPEDLQGVVAIDGGRAHSMALRADGRVVVWGENDHGQRNVPAKATNIVAIAAGWSHNLALRADGEVVAWGYNGDGAVTVPAEAKSHVVAIDAQLTSMALRDDGTVVSWGSEPRLGEIPSGQNHGFVAIGLGRVHAVGLRRDGTVYAWGENFSGQTSVPAGLSNVVAISVGGYHTLAMKADGTIVAWGAKEPVVDSGQCDVPASLSRYETYLPPTKSSDLLVTSATPSQFNGRLMNGVGWTDGSPALGALASRALSFDGQDDYVHLTNGVYFNTNFTIEAWIYPRAHSIWARVLDFSNTNTTSGINECVVLTFCDASGLRPHLRVGQKSFTATQALRLNEWVHLAATLNGTNATLYANGVAIGAGTVSQPLNVVRNNSKFGASNSPGEPNADFVLDELRIWNVALTPAQIAAGMTNRPAVTEPNLVAAWGFDDWPRPSIAAMTSGAKQVAAGRDFNLALRSDDTVSAWGANTVGQCAVPSDLGAVTAIAAGSGHGLALKTNNNGSVVAWGWNACGQAKVPAAALHDVMAVAAGGAHSLALKRDGTVLAWGRNNAMQTNVPAGLDSVVAIAAGGQHSLALKADSTVVSWGWNGYGQTNTIGLGDVVAIAAGENHSVALLTNGCVVAWGCGDRGQTEVPLAARSGVVAIAAEKDHTLALKSDGTVVAWGGNAYGQTNLPAGLGKVVALAAGERHNLFLTAQPAGSNDLGAEFVLANVPSAITEEWLPAVYDDLIDNVTLLGTTELSGAKELIEAVLELGMPYTMERDDVLHGFFHGTEALPDQDIVTELFTNERDRLLNTPHARPMLLGNVLSPRFACFADRLNQRLLDLQATGQPEIPRLVGHTLRLLKLLRDAHAVTPPPAVEADRQTSGLDVVLYSEPYARYAIEYCTDLKAPAWSSVTTNLHSGERVTRSLPGDAQGWYRAVLPPRKMD